MNFQGLKDYNTADPQRLRIDLQRQNQAVAEALAALEREREAVLVPRTTTKDTAARIGEMVVAQRALKVFLPPSSPTAAGKRVAVVKATSGTVLIVAAPKNSVVGLNVYAMPTFGQLMSFYDDGQGGFWGA